MFCQTLEGGNGDVVEIGEEQDILMEKPKALQHSFNEERKKQRKETKPSTYYRKT